MKNEQLYNETVNIILDAYNKKQLQAGDPCGCFIGNIIAHKMGVTKIYENGTPDYESHWYGGVICPLQNAHQNADLFTLPDGGKADPEEGKRQIELTGYSVDEVLFLEHTFEQAANKILYNWDERTHDTETIQQRANLAGMKAALELLAEIHETKEEDSISRLEKIHEEVYENCALV